jgi:hypothetical protein
MSTPVTKCPQQKAQSVLLAKIHNMQQVHAKRDMREEEALKESITKAVEENLQAESKARVEKVLSSITDVGYESLYDFVDKLPNSCDQQISACVLRMLGQHGEDILNSIHARKPDLAIQWVVNVSGKILAQEGQKLMNYLCLQKDVKICNYFLWINYRNINHEKWKILHKLFTTTQHPQALDLRTIELDT